MTGPTRLAAALAAVAALAACPGPAPSAAKATPAPKKAAATAAPKPAAKPVAVTATLVAGGTPGYKDANGTAAAFEEDGPLVVDGLGSCYVFEVFKRRLRKIAANGDVTTVLTGSPGGFADGPLATAKSDTWTYMAADGAGNLYFHDGDGGGGAVRLRKLAPDGQLSTLAGGGTQAVAAGVAGPDARLSDVGAIAADPDGTVFWGMNERKIVSLGKDGKLAIAADYSGEADLRLAGIARAGGKTYFGRPTYPRIYVGDAKHTVFVGAADGGAQDGKGTAARLGSPTGPVARPDGGLIVNDGGTLRLIAKDGTVSTAKVTLDGADLPLGTARLAAAADDVFYAYRGTRGLLKLTIAK